MLPKKWPNCDAIIAHCDKTCCLAFSRSKTSIHVIYYFDHLVNKPVCNQVFAGSICLVTLFLRFVHENISSAILLFNEGIFQLMLKE